MTTETKTFSVIAAVSILLIAGVLFFYSKSQPTQSVIDPSILVHSDSHQIVATSSNVTLVEFGDYECPACGAAYPVVNQVLAEFKGKINFVFRNYPLPMHRYAQISAQAAEAAGEQDKFWQMHDMLYEKQDAWAESTDPRKEFAEYAKEIGLDVAEFNKALDAKKFQARIDQDSQDGEKAGVSGTPTFYINGVQVELHSWNDLKTAVTNALK